MTRGGHRIGKRIRGITASVLAGALALALFVGHGPGGTTAFAQETQDKQPPYVLLRADEVIYDENTEIVTAIGKVEIAHEEEILRADKVTYDENRDVVIATGNVVLLEPTGDVMFAERAEFTDGMKDAIIESFRMLLSDNSRLAAAGGSRTGGVVTTMNKAVFSPCDLCEEDPNRAPLWQVRAVRVIHDSEHKDIEYEDAWLELWGVPVLYTPYLSHPDPSVKRRTGLLAPSQGSDTQLGFFLQTPFFWELAPNEDVTITPYFYSDVADVLRANYRRRFAHGEVEFDGSLTRPDRLDSNGDATGGTDTRGHLFAKGRFDHDNIWRTRFQVEHASDDTYLRRYHMPLPNSRTLTSSFTTEGFYGQNYAQVSGYSFQGLREDDDPGQSPLVLPYGSYHYTSQPFANGSFLTADASALAISRGEGTDSRRLSLNTGWNLPHVGSTGEIINLSASLQTDIYSVNDVVTGTGDVESGVTGRVFPQLMAEWRYPLARPDQTATQVIEPRAAVVVAPNGGNSELIPNEDSSVVEFDTTNLFSPNRFAGTDRVENGTRFIYGVNWSIYGHEGGAIETFIGQSYRLHEQREFGNNSGLADKLSDIVGSISVAPNSWVDFLYRFRYDTESAEPRRNEAEIWAGPENFKLGLNYLFLDEDDGTGQFGEREELVMRFKARLGRYWEAGGHIRENLANNGDTINESLYATYEDECITFRVTGKRSFTQDRDLRPTDTLMFQVIFKYLGEFSSAG